VHADLIASLQSLKILVVGDDSAVRASLVSEIDAAGHVPRTALHGDPALDLFEIWQPDVVLICIDPEGQMDGYSSASALREAAAEGWTPIILVSPNGDEHEVWQGIEAGGDDYLVSPVPTLILHAKLRATQRLVQMRGRLVELAEALHGANAQLHALATVDALTGLLNRRALDHRLRQEIDLARRSRNPLSVLLCDVDHFKRYNDSLGHGEGDACLKRVAIVFQRACRRPSDCAARYGGEEFALILPNTPVEGAALVAQQLRDTLAAEALPHPTSETGRWVTLSGGLVTCVPDALTRPEALLQQADAALYRAKAQGRDQICVSEPSASA
jgi:diguanylate cyclase (GGDEF)-like protein